MRYSKILKCDIANGLGWRVSVWVSGCERRCKGCFNPEAWNPDYGLPFDEEAKGKIFKELENPVCQGLSILGGEPLSKLSDNRQEVLRLCRECKERYPNKTIWIYSGYTFEKLVQEPTAREIFNHVDVLVDGEFVQELKNAALAFRGSSNQRVLDMKETMKKG